MADYIFLRSRSTEIPTLSELALRTILDNLDRVHSLGFLPDDITVKIASHCNREQLERLENNSTHIKPLTDSFWREFCRRELGIRDAAALNKHKSWRTVYQHTKREHEQKIKQAGGRLRQIYEEEAKTKQERRITVVSNAIPPKGRKRSDSGKLSALKSSKPSLLEKSRLEAEFHRAMFTSPIQKPLSKPIPVKPLNAKSVDGGGSVRVQRSSSSSPSSSPPKLAQRKLPFPSNDPKPPKNGVQSADSVVKVKSRPSKLFLTPKERKMEEQRAVHAKASSVTTDTRKLQEQILHREALRKAARVLNSGAQSDSSADSASDVDSQEESEQQVSKRRGTPESRNGPSRTSQLNVQADVEKLLDEAEQSKRARLSSFTIPKKR